MHDRGCCVLLCLVLGTVLGVAGCDDADPGSQQSSQSTQAAAREDATPPAGSAPGQPQVQADPSQPPRLTFQSTDLNLGRLSEVEQRTGTFHFTNTGGQTLIIQQIKTSCGCTTPTLAKREYLPGERGTIDITLTPTVPSTEPKIVNVIANTQPEMTRLLVHAEITPFLDLQPRMLETGVLRHRQEHRFTVSVTCPADEQFVIEKIHTSNPEISAALLPASPGSSARTIQITIPPTASWGNLFSWLEVTGRAMLPGQSRPVSHTSKIRIQGQIFGELHAEPDTFRFGVKPGERFERSITLSRSNGQPFELISATVATCDLPNTSVQVQRQSPSRYVLILRSQGDRLRSIASGTVLVQTNVPGEEQIVLPISGVVRSEYPGVK